MGESASAYCSWCFRLATHDLMEVHFFSRNGYRCGACGNRTYKCRWCDNMARGSPDLLPEGLFERLKESWNDELCAEHDGTIASFARLSLRLDDLAGYAQLFKREKMNLKRLGTGIAWTLGGAVVFGPLAYIAAPGIAA